MLDIYRFYFNQVNDNILTKLSGSETKSVPNISPRLILLKRYWRSTISKCCRLKEKYKVVWAHWVGS